MDGPKTNNEHVEVISTAAPVTNSTQLAKLTNNAQQAHVHNALQAKLDRMQQGIAQLNASPVTNIAVTNERGPLLNLLGMGDPFVRSTYLRFLLDGTRDIDTECGYPAWLTPDHYRAMYDREGAAKRVVHCEPEEAWAEDPDLYEDEDPNTDTKFEKAWKDLNRRWNIWHHLMRIDILSGLGQYGILLIGIDDGKELWEPADGIDEAGNPTGKPKHKLLYLRPFDETVTFIKAREVDTANPRYGQPVMYRIEFRDFPNWGVQAGEIVARDVHWTRVIHVADNRKMSEVFGVPRQQQVYNRLYDLRKIYSASGEGYWKGAFPGISFEIMPEIAQQGIDFTEDDKKALRQEMDDYQRGLQRYIALNGMSAKPLPIQVVDPTGMAQAHLTAIAICLDIPMRILFGTEEAQLAGTQDGRKWARRLKRRNLRYTEPLIIRPFVDRLIAFGILPKPKDFFVDWPDLNSPTDGDKAAIAAQMSTALANYVSSGSSQLMGPDVFLTKICGFTPEEAREALDGAQQMSIGQQQMDDDAQQQLDDHEGNLGVGGVQQDTGSVLLQDALSGTGTLPKKGKNKRRVDTQMTRSPSLPNLNMATNTDGDGSAADGHWVTMDGTHVFIQGGKITKGPSKMVGKTPSIDKLHHKESGPYNVVDTDKSGRGKVEENEDGSTSYAGVHEHDWMTWASESDNINAATAGDLKTRGNTDSMGTDLTDEDVKDYARIGKAIQSAAEVHAVTNPPVLYRGESGKNYKVGQKITFDRLTSATTDKGAAGDYAAEGEGENKKPVILHIQNPNGVPGVQTSPLGVPSNEVVMPKGVSYRVARVEGENVWLYSSEKHKRKAVDASSPESPSKTSVINVQPASAPNVNIEPAVINVHLPNPPRTVRRIVRDAEGRIAEIREEVEPAAPDPTTPTTPEGT